MHSCFSVNFPECEQETAFTAVVKFLCSSHYSQDVCFAERKSSLLHRYLRVGSFYYLISVESTEDSTLYYSKTFIQTFIVSRLDYCNASFIDLSAKTLEHFQKSLKPKFWPYIKVNCYEQVGGVQVGVRGGFTGFSNSLVG